MNIDEQLDSILIELVNSYVRNDVYANYDEAKSALKKLIVEARVEENQVFMARLGRYTETSGVKKEVLNHIESLKESNNI